MAPFLTGVTTPANGQGHAGTVVTVSGTGLSGASKVNIGTKSVTPSSSTSTTVTFTAPSGCSGQSNVSVVVGGVTSNTVAFFYVAPPTCTSMSTNSGPASPPSLTITGTGLSTVVAGGVAFGAATTSATSTTGDTELTATPPGPHTFAPGVCTDTVEVVLTNVGGSSTANAPACSFTYYNAPTVTDLSPDVAAVSNTNVVVTGTCFVDVSSVTFTPTGGGASTSATFTPLSTTSLSVDVPTLPADAYHVQVTTPGGPSATGTADIYTTAAPTVTGLTPNTGPTGTSVTVAGINFGNHAADVTGVTFTPTGGGASTSATFTYVPGTGLTTTVPGTLVAGTYDVQVTTAAGTSTPNVNDVFTVT